MNNKKIKIKKKKQWSSGTAPALQVQNPEFKLQYHHHYQKNQPHVIKHHQINGEGSLNI
jgi:hypothetical protein